MHPNGISACWRSWAVPSRRSSCAAIQDPEALLPGNPSKASNAVESGNSANGLCAFFGKGGEMALEPDR